ncbi:hypothetical protein CTAYLR_009299 [Chrysophaeum taylorii]|uniref:Ankyrin repeat domain containing protein n=1 Tax=Chrysophaeum taylorii TaxID=2483200 RepID=A0AAD7UK59_9STRA|nr:hypothetical protein CTAYLR_009299 [Chrysophaeum taylorii]
MKPLAMLNGVDDDEAPLDTKRGVLLRMVDAKEEWLFGLVDGVSEAALLSLVESRAASQSVVVELSKLFDKVGVENHVTELLKLMVPWHRYEPRIDENVELPPGVGSDVAGSYGDFKDFVELGATNWVERIVQKCDHLRVVVCALAAHASQLEVLKWARANGCPWDEVTCESAALGGHLDVLRWARANECPWDGATCAGAAKNGHLEVVKWARANGCPWDERTCAAAAREGQFHVLEWARANGCPWNDTTCLWAAAAGNLDVLKWLRANGCPWDRYTCSVAARAGHLEVLKWARQNGCPWRKAACVDSTHPDVQAWVRRQPDDDDDDDDG